MTVTGEASDSISVTFTNGAHTRDQDGDRDRQRAGGDADGSGDLTTLTNGTISVSATQTDAAGNAQTVAAATTSFVLDTLAPTVARGDGQCCRTGDQRTDSVTASASAKR